MGRQCRKCKHYDRPRCTLTDTYTTAKGYCEDWNGELDGYADTRPVC